MHGEDRLNIKTQLIKVALKFAEFPDHISIDYTLILTLILIQITFMMANVLCVLNSSLELRTPNEARKSYWDVDKWMLKLIAIMKEVVEIYR